MANPVDDAGNVRVDHVWGNMPMQPNDARGENVLDYTLDNHEIVETGRYGFPGYNPSWIGDGDDVPNVVVPNVVGLNGLEAAGILVDAGLEVAEPVTVNEGATEENDGNVASQSPAAGSNANLGDTVTLSLYELLPEGFVTADETFTGVALDGFADIGWSFAKSGHTVAVGDWVRASGYYVVDASGNRTPSGEYDVNGDWLIDNVTATTFSSAALRAELAGLAGPNASSFDLGTVAVDHQ